MDPYADIISDLEDRQASEKRARENLAPVSSSWIGAYSYDPLAHTLYVQFHDRKGRPTVKCAYYEVSEDIWQGFLNAASKGGFFHSSGLIHWHYEIVG